MRIPWLASAKGSQITIYEEYGSKVSIIDSAIGAQSKVNWEDLYKHWYRSPDMVDKAWKLRNEKGNSLTLQDLRLEILGIEIGADEYLISIAIHEDSNED